MPRVSQPITEYVEAGRELPILFKSVPADETLTDAVLKAGFTTCLGRPYNAPPDPNAISRSDAKKNVRIWPKPRKKKPAIYMTGRFPRAPHEV